MSKISVAQNKNLLRGRHSNNYCLCIMGNKANIYFHTYNNTQDLIDLKYKCFHQIQYENFYYVFKEWFFDIFTKQLVG